MSEAKTQADPTMEEMLASIRRIIPEDDPYGRAGEDEAPTQEPEPEPEVAAAEPEPEPEPEAESELELQPEAMAEDSGEDDSLLSQEAQAAATASLAEVARAAATERPAASLPMGDGRTLEDLVREALGPELKAWLEANLSPLVEQIVRDEVKRLARRAEDQ